VKTHQLESVQDVASDMFELYIERERARERGMARGREGERARERGMARGREGERARERISGFWSGVGSRVGGMHL
jgi:hypothetical protein